MGRRTPTWQPATWGEPCGKRDRIRNGGAESPLNGRDGVAPAPTPEITIVAPTRNEEAVIGAFIDSLDEELAGIHAELIVVDDSDDAYARRRV